MKINFPPDTSLFQLASDLQSCGWRLSGRQNPDGSYDALALGPIQPQCTLCNKPAIISTDAGLFCAQHATFTLDLEISQ